MLKLYVKIRGKYKEVSAVLPNAGVVKRITIQKAIAKYVEICTSQKCLKNQSVEKKFFESFLGFCLDRNLTSISDVTSGDLIEFQNELARKMKPASVNRRFFTIKHLFGMCDRWGYLVKDHCRDIKSKRAEKNPYKTWTEKEYESLVAQSNGIHKELIRFLWHTGCRPMEAKNLRWTDINIVMKKDDESKVDFAASEITFKCGKNAKISRSFPLTEKNFNVLHSVDMKGNAVFQNISNDNLYQYVKHRLIKLKLKHLTVYGLRHSFASRLSKSGVNVFLIQKLMGHSDIKTTSGYVNSDKKELIEALRCANF